MKQSEGSVVVAAAADKDAVTVTVAAPPPPPPQQQMEVGPQHVVVCRIPHPVQKLSLHSMQLTNYVDVSNFSWNEKRTGQGESSILSRSYLYPLSGDTDSAGKIISVSEDIKTGCTIVLSKYLVEIGEPHNPKILLLSVTAMLGIR
ncbi:uncharacterized protein LOC126680317 [Mercurialis annua]|uniref:uncharacterized protein LOC126680317 n=1 Tax=Mercurialis annua TaxID=3986 RepID=UPI00215F15C3|nr:uncharacterized protein LOC126676575 isoform X2 [Mercurialis annua]XP_050231378.1 uncharacterized protein LOC126680317 [Mercurialis annua]XP_055961323.1 uncharacterized protein LOC126676575 isoform X2 [Mercurialis annua]XP_055961647.1 uncharacterized protein LOC126680317 [Mercurialis annua]